MLSDYFFPQKGGGTEKVVYEISKRLTKMGCDILVITLGSNEAQGVYEVDGIKICRLPGVNLTDIIGLQTAFPKDVIGACRIAKDFQPHVVHAHNRFFSTTLLAVLIKRVCNTRLIVSAHLGDVRNLALIDRWKSLAVTAYEHTLSRFIFASSDKVIAVSEAVRKHLVSLGIPPKKIVLIQNGVDSEEFTCVLPKYNPESYTTILFIGRLLPNKGLKTLVEAARIISATSSRKITFKIVGDGPDRAQINELIEMYSMRDNFHFLGEVPRVSDVFQEGGIFVRPSLTEGMPLTILEAMSSGLPIVATNVGGTSELIKHNERGLLVEVDNEAQLAKAILNLVGNPKRAERLGQNARAFVKRHYEKKYSWNAVATKNHSVYKTLVGK